MLTSNLGTWVRFRVLIPNFSRCVRFRFPHSFLLSAAPVKPIGPLRVALPLVTCRGRGVVDASLLPFLTVIALGGSNVLPVAVVVLAPRCCRTFTPGQGLHGARGLCGDGKPRRKAYSEVYP